MIKHVMLDLETLSTKPNALVLAIGACEIDFLSGAIGRKYYRTIVPGSFDGKGAHIDPYTVLWWMRQSDAARQAIHAQTDSKRMEDVLSEFHDWLWGLGAYDSSDLQIHAPIMWGNGADFDNAILTHWYEKSNTRMPWSYRDNRCFRTVRNLFPDTPDPAANEIAHHALHDAEWQANKLILINNRHNLGLKNET